MGVVFLIVFIASVALHGHGRYRSKELDRYEFYNRKAGGVEFATFEESQRHQGQRERAHFFMVAGWTIGGLSLFCLMVSLWISGGRL